MNQRYHRHTEATRLLESRRQLHKEYCLQQLQESEPWSASNRVRITSAVEGEVTPSNNKVFLTNLAHRTCTCGHFQINGIPCGHAFSVIRAFQNRSPREYIPTFFTLATWQNTYRTNLRPISLANLDIIAIQAAANMQDDVENHDIIEPIKERASIGRPQLARRVAGGQRKRAARAQARLNGSELPPNTGKGSQCCRRCGHFGHNRVTCDVVLNF